MQNQIFVSNHAKRRLKQRLGIRYGAALRSAKSVLAKARLVKQSGSHIHAIVNGVCYVFEQSGDTLTLITVLTSGAHKTISYKGGKVRRLDLRYGESYQY